MLFDPEQEKRQLFELGKPSLKALSYALRHEDVWPKGFQWNFSRCESCAMGLAIALWNQIRIKSNWNKFVSYCDPISEALGMDERIAYDIFGASCRFSNYKPAYSNLTYGEITPTMVADELDRYCETHN